MAWGRPLGSSSPHLAALSATYSPKRRKGVGEGRMVKEMRLDRTPWSLHHHYTCAKFLVCILLIGISVRLLLSSSWGFFPFSEHATNPPKAERPASVGGVSSSPDKNASAQMSIPDMVDEDPQREKCDLFDGEWIPHPSGPAYTNDSCLLIEAHQNCRTNGRPDTGYLYWKWKPKGCDLPLFDTERFLDAMRNKWWAFIGDSISRNHVQSLICLLSKVDKAIEVYHDEEWKSRRWYFSSYNFTLSVIWSPFLVKAEISEDPNGVSSKDIQLHLDTLDEGWISQLRQFDYVITSGGKWFPKAALYWENNTLVGCHYCPGRNLSELGYDYAYRKVLDLVLHHLTSSGYKATVLFRTSTPDHFENGEWSDGGTCKRTVPFKGGEASMKEVDRVLRKVELAAFKKAAGRAPRNGTRLKLLDTTYLSLLRPDGHPGPYRTYHPFAEDKNAKVQNDCLHWCLPGPIDYWNDLLMEMVLNDRR